jgi:ParB family transcriptional regulator, chromosome partitioning protein
MTETKRLGRGLEALLGPMTREQAEATGTLRELPVGMIRPNPFQPRRELDETGLVELAASIEASGLLQPVVVRPEGGGGGGGGGGGYELIAGERRWRAVQRLGWARVPAVVRDVDDQSLLTLALIENLQRDDLSPIDEARGYRRLMDEFELPQGEVARLVGRNRSTIANSLRLLTLPVDVQALVGSGVLSEGHGRALLALGDGREISRVAAQVVERGWSVRDTEALTRGEGPGGSAGNAGGANALRSKLHRKPPVRQVHAEQRRIEETLRRHLGTDVRVTAKRRGRGTVAIWYYSNDDLARVLERILGEPYDG